MELVELVVELAPNRP